MASSSRPTVRCRKTKSSDDFSDDDDDYALAVPQTGVSSINPVIKIDTNCNLPLLVQVGPVNHREEVRRQRMESEQRRRASSVTNTAASRTSSGVESKVE